MRSSLLLTLIVAGAVTAASAGGIEGAPEHTGGYGGDVELDGEYEEGFSVLHAGEYEGGKSYIITKVGQGHGGGFGKGIFSHRAGQGIGGLLSSIGGRDPSGSSESGKTYIINSVKGISYGDLDGVYEEGHEVGWW